MNRIILTTFIACAALLAGCGEPSSDEPLTSKEESRINTSSLDVAMTALANTTNGSATYEDEQKASGHAEWMVRLVAKKACAKTEDGIVRDDARSMMESLENAGLQDDADDVRAALRDAPKCS